MSNNKNVCHWKYCWNYDMDYWTTDCGEEFCLIEGEPNENRYNYCPNCGGKLIEIKEDKTND